MSELRLQEPETLVVPDLFTVMFVVLIVEASICSLKVADMVGLVLLT